MVVDVVLLQRVHDVVDDENVWPVISRVAVVVVVVVAAAAAKSCCPSMIPIHCSTMSLLSSAVVVAYSYSYDYYYYYYYHCYSTLIASVPTDRPNSDIDRRASVVSFA